MLTQADKNKYMTFAIEEAKKAEALGEVPIGAIVVYNGEVVGQGYNQRESAQQATAHAELLAIQEANEKLGRWRLEECQLFVTLEPCTMCSGAIVLARIPEVYYGASDVKSGTAGSLINLLDYEPLNHQAYVEKGILGEECSQMLKDFFKDLRKRNKERKKNTQSKPKDLSQ